MKPVSWFPFFCKVLISLFFASVLCSCASGTVVRHDASPTETRSGYESGVSSIDRHAMLGVIMGMMSIPYKLQGTDTNGMDCSGFTEMVFDSVLHQKLPHSSREQFSSGRPVDARDIRFGDLVFFQLEQDGPSHVGIYVGDGLFAHASVSRGVTISLIDVPYYHERFVGARRIVY